MDGPPQRQLRRRLASENDPRLRSYSIQCSSRLYGPGYRVYYQLVDRRSVAGRCHAGPSSLPQLSRWRRRHVRCVARRAILSSLFMGLTQEPFVHRNSRQKRGVFEPEFNLLPTASGTVCSVAGRVALVYAFHQALHVYVICVLRGRWHLVWQLALLL